MSWKTMAAMVAATLVCAVPGRSSLAAADGPALAGRWTLNRQLSQLPRDVGFGMDLVSGPGADAGTGGGRGRSEGGGTGLGTMASVRESEDDARRRELLVDRERNPSTHLTITEAPTSVTITDDRLRSLTFHPDGREESQMFAEVPVTTISRWEGTRLEVRFKVEQNREIRCIYSRIVAPPQLVVQVQFVERGGRGTLTRVYEPAKPNEVMTQERPGAVPTAVSPQGAAPAAGTPPTLTPPTWTPPAGVPRGSDFGNPPNQSQQPAGRGTSPVVARGPDAELKGITRLGVVVEDLSPQAATCGLSQAPVEAAVTKSLSDAGLPVRRNADEDTYLYVNVNTTSAPGGLCVSRYDVYLYTYTTATLSYQTAPALVQVTLLHKGGIAGGSPAAHAESVMRSVKQYADEFASRIRAVNR